MTSVLSVALLTQMLLVSSGLALLQLCSPRRRIQILPLLPYAWGTGVALLYLAGGVFVKSEWLLRDWHWLVAAGMVLLTIAGAVAYLHRQSDHDDLMPMKPVVSIRWYDACIIALIALHVSLVAYICMTNSVFDSDATGMRRHVGLAKKIGEGISFSDVMQRGRGHTDPIGPSLLPAWIRLFSSRWHDSVASLPWLIAWLGSGYIAFVSCYRLMHHLTASLVCTFVFLSLPLVSIHVFRSGFADLLLMYFLIIGFSMVALVFLAKEKLGPGWWVLMPTAVLGAALCKSEGKMWALFLIVMWVSHYLHERKGMPWIKLIGTQILAAAVFFCIYYFALGEDFFNSLDDSRLRLLAPASFNQTAFDSTLKTLFQRGSFGILWWAVILGGTYLLFARGATENTKAMAFSLLSMLVAVIYFSNFTENIKFTINGTNVSRFLVQLSGMLIPLYCALAQQWFPEAVPLTDRSKRDSGRKKPPRPKS